MRKPRFVHDPDCDAIRLDLTANGVAHPCTCKERQKARARVRPSAGGADWFDFAQTHQPTGCGNYRAHTPYDE